MPKPRSIWLGVLAVAAGCVPPTQDEPDSSSLDRCFEWWPGRCAHPREGAVNAVCGASKTYEGMYSVLENRDEQTWKDGRLSQERWQRFPSGETDPGALWLTTYGYTGEAWTTRDEDVDGDGSIDRKTSREFDPNGRLVREKHGSGDGRSLEDTLEYEYPDGQRVIREIRGGAEVAVMRIRYSGGRPSGREYDRGANGTIDDTAVYTYEGNRIARADLSYRTSEEAPFQRFTISYSYDARGRYIRFESVRTDDERPDTVVQRIYGPSPNQLTDTREQFRDDGTSTSDSTRLAWDPQGRLMRIERDDDGDGLFEARWDYEPCYWMDDAALSTMWLGGVSTIGELLD
jgi:hypothetical protein